MAGNHQVGSASLPGHVWQQAFTSISKLMFVAILITAKTSYLNSHVVQYIAMAIIASQLE